MLLFFGFALLEPRCDEHIPEVSELPLMKVKKIFLHLYELLNGAVN